MLRWALAFLVLSSSTAASAATMAVLPLRAEGLQLHEANRLNLLLRARAGTKGGYAVQGEDLTNSLVEASQALGVDCDLNAVACGVEIGKIADVEFVLLGRAVKLPATATAPTLIGIDVQLVDVKGAVGLRRILGQISLDSDQQTKDVDAAAVALFGKDVLPTLSLNVTDGAAKLDGVTIKLDGVTLGATPLTTTQGLLPGSHVLVAEKKTYLPYTTAFTINAGEGAQIDIQLVFDPDAEKEVISPLQIALPFVGAGVGGVVAIVGGGLIVGGVQPWQAHQQANADLAELEQNGADNELFPDKAAELNEKSAAEARNWQTWGLPTTVAGSVAVGVGLVAATVGITWGVILLNADPEADAAAASPTPSATPAK